MRRLACLLGGCVLIVCGPLSVAWAGPGSPERLRRGAVQRLCPHVGGNVEHLRAPTRPDQTAFPESDAGVLNTPGSDYAISTYTIPAANRTSTTSGLSMAVQIGKSPAVTVKFDTSGVLSVVGGGVIPGAPSVTITAS